MIIIKILEQTSARQQVPMQRKKHILIIASNYYQKIYDNLLKESVDEISFQNFLYTTETVTGVFEI